MGLLYVPIITEIRALFPDHTYTKEGSALSVVVPTTIISLYGRWRRELNLGMDIEDVCSRRPISL